MTSHETEAPRSVMPFQKIKNFLHVSALALAHRNSSKRYRTCSSFRNFDFNRMFLRSISSYCSYLASIQAYAWEGSPVEIHYICIHLRCLQWGKGPHWLFVCSRWTLPKLIPSAQNVASVDHATWHAERKKPYLYIQPTSMHLPACFQKTSSKKSSPNKKYQKLSRIFHSKF